MDKLLSFIKLLWNRLLRYLKIKKMPNQQQVIQSFRDIVLIELPNILRLDNETPLIIIDNGNVSKISLRINFQNHCYLIVSYEYINELKILSGETDIEDMELLNSLYSVILSKKQQMSQLWN